MQINALSRSLLRLVFSLSSGATTLTRPRLARRLGVSSNDLNHALDELSRLGLLDARRLRLTLPGLAVAVACAEAKAATPQMSAISPLIALFSQREAPRAVA